MSRSNTKCRKSQMLPGEGRDPSPKISDHSELAEHMLRAGHKAAKKAATDNYRAAQCNSDNASAEFWYTVSVWINLLNKE